MARQDAYLGTRKDSINDYFKATGKYLQGEKPEFYRVYDSKLKGYKYIIATVDANKVYSYFYFYKGGKLYNTKTSKHQTSIPPEKVDGNLIKLYPCTLTMKGRILRIMYDMRFFW